MFDYHNLVSLQLCVLFIFNKELVEYGFYL